MKPAIAAPSLQCQLETLAQATPVAALTDLTVGEKFKLLCDGATEKLHSDKLEIKNKDMSDETAALSILQTIAVNPTHLELLVTSYRVGEHKSDSVVLWDGETKTDLNGFSWNLKTVVKQDAGQPPQPFPAFPMVKLAYPAWFWFLLAMILIAAVIGPYSKIQSVKKRKKQFEDLKNLDSALNPLDQFFKEMRKLEKLFDNEPFPGLDFVIKLSEHFRFFLSRSLQLPVHLWADSQSLKEIRNKYPKIARDFDTALKKYFSELKKTSKQVSKKDALFLQKEGQKLVEAIDSSLEKYHRGKK